MTIRLLTVLRFGIDGCELLDPEGIVDDEVQETLHCVVFGDDIALNEFFADFCSHLCWRFAGEFDKGEYHQSDISFELGTRFLQLDLVISGIDII